MDRREKNISRREFIRHSTVSAAALGAVALAGSYSALAAQQKTRKVSLALVGTGIRGSTTWGTELLKEVGDYVEIVGLCDINPLRVEVANRWMGGKIPTFTDFDKMLEQTRPDRVMVTVMDCYHAQYVCR